MEKVFFKDSIEISYMKETKPR